MNRFDNFFRGMNDEEWEKFAVYVLSSVGYNILTLPAYGTDGGKDFLVSANNIICLVSCKHNINSQKHVGSDDEKNIVDRLLQHNAKCFIGFYSTGITTGLQDRLDGIAQNGGNSYSIFDPQNISIIMQNMDTKVLQSFGLYPGKYYINVSNDEYEPLNCIFCGKDILTNENIANSIAGLTELKDGTYDFVYGCKTCLSKIILYLDSFIEVEQSLHVTWMQGWDQMIDAWITEDELKLNKDFYYNRHQFSKGVRQRQLPQTDGNWYGL